MNIIKKKFKNSFHHWSKFQYLLNEEMDSVANFPCDEEEDLAGLYWKRIKQSDEQYCFFLEVDGKLVGSLTYIGYNKHISIRDFYINPDYRNRGYGTKLLEEVCKCKRGRIMYIGTVGGNENALRLYEKFGFKIIGYNMQMN